MFLKRKIRKEIIDLNIYKSKIEIQLSDSKNYLYWQGIRSEVDKQITFLKSLLK